MKKSLELSDDKSCLNRARDDEVVFVLLGRDAAFAKTVIYWALERIRLGKNTPNDNQIGEAIDCAISVLMHQSAVKNATVHG